MQYNNDFFSYNGYINRKNYIINMLILIALYGAMMLVNFESFIQYTNQKFLLTVLLFLTGFFKFILIMSAISVIYRRIADISKSRSTAFSDVMKRLFILLIVFPVLYLYCIRYFLDFIPFLIYTLDFTTFYILIPVAVLTLITIAFIKGE